MKTNGPSLSQQARPVAPIESMRHFLSGLCPYRAPFSANQAVVEAVVETAALAPACSPMPLVATRATIYSTLPAVEGQYKNGFSFIWQNIEPQQGRDEPALIAAEWSVCVHLMASWATSLIILKVKTRGNIGSCKWKFMRATHKTPGDLYETGLILICFHACSGGRMSEI